jgi:hypothetical protein
VSSGVHSESSDDYPRWASWIPVYSGLLAAAASIWAIILYEHPSGLVAYAVATAAGLFVGWIALVLTAWVIMLAFFVARISTVAIVLAIVAGIIFLIRHHAG